MKSGSKSKSKSSGATKAADTKNADADDDGGFNVVKAAKKLLKKLPMNSPTMELHDLARKLQKQQQKKKRTKGSEEDEATSIDGITPSQLRATLEAAGGKFEFRGDANGDGDGSAVLVLLRDGDRSSSSSKKRKNKGGGDEKVAKKEEKKKRQRSASSEGRSKSSAAATPGNQSSVAAWRKSHKVVVMVEPTPEGATPPANPVVEQHLVPVQSFADLKGAVTEASWKIPLEALIQRLSKDFERPSPIQAQAWPVLLRRHNLVGIAETGRYVRARACGKCVAYKEEGHCHDGRLTRRAIFCIINSGKTLGFCLPALVQLKATQNSSTSQRRRPVRMLVLSPTRELAMQSHQVLHEYGHVVGISSLVVYGGVSKADQERSIRQGNVDAVVATPGRLKDLLVGGYSNNNNSYESSSSSSKHGRNRNSGNGNGGGGGAGGGVLDLSQVQYLVLDEADRMLDLGFFPDVQHIVGQCTRTDRQTCLFSATWPASIQTMAASLLHPPPAADASAEHASSAAAAVVRVYVGFESVVKERPANPDGGSTEGAASSAGGDADGSASDEMVVVDDALSANKRVKQTIEVMEDHQRESRLRTLLSQVPKQKSAKGEPHRVLVFCLYKKEAERLEHRLKQTGLHCTSIHGNKAQNDRTQALDKFKTGEIPLLIATDVAARGLHIPDVYMVINYTFPLTIEDYVHRIGRTGRAGQSGLSVTFFQPLQDKARAGELQQVLRQAGQEIPEALAKFGSTIKKKEHKLYGNFGPSSGGGSGLPMKKATKTTFNYSDDEGGN
jgi:ATP-dependent RNA helicase DBP3